VTYGEALKYAVNCLKPMNLTMPGLEARELLVYASESCGVGIRKDDINRLGAIPCPPDFDECLDELLERRLRGEPLAYIIGEWDFYGLTLEVNPDVLIPRQDTETVVERALVLLDGVAAPKILDLCCGSGAIGIALLKNIPDATCVFADISPAALRVCRKNVANHELLTRSMPLELDALEPAPTELSGFDIIVCNPPYISSDEMNALPVDVAGFEPHDALYGGYDGLSFYRAISTGFKSSLKPGGVLLYECGAYQAAEVENILKNAGFCEITRYLDLNKFERAVSARVI
jgi:release factor glutamine methyltransferase